MPLVTQSRLDDLLRDLVVLVDQCVHPGAERGARLHRDRAERLLDTLHVFLRLFEVLFEQRPQIWIRHRLDHVFQHVERKPPLDPEQLRELRDEEVLEARDLLHVTRLFLRRFAQRSAMSMITSAGFAAPSVGNTEPSTTNRLGTPHTRCEESITESRELKPMRAPPTRWA